MDNSDTHVEIRLPVADCPATHVTVFRDRAEVTRLVTISPQAEGNHMVVIQGITDRSNTDSFRLKGLPVEEDGGSSVIQEVTFDVHVEKHDTDLQGGNHAAMKKLREAEAKVTAVKAKIARVQEQNDYITKYMSAMLTGTKTFGPNNQIVQTVGVDLDKVENLLAFHATQSAGIDAKIATLTEELRLAKEEKTVAETALKSLNRLTRSNVRTSRNISVLLFVEKPGTLKLALTYLVTSASWAPSYDMRIESLSNGGDASAADPTLSMTYFGVVRQDTGEDWQNVSMSLSTAAPATGGTPPSPPTKLAKWTTYARPTFVGLSNMVQSNMAMPRVPQRKLSISADELDMSSDEDDDDDSGEDGITKVATAAVQTASGAATFVIQRRASISTDNKEHKVTISLLTFAPKLRYFCTPELEERAYIQARLTNTSAFPLLASNSVAIFVGGSFLTKTSLKHTSPGETFNVFLGPDPLVKVEHKVLKETYTKGKPKSGVFASAERSKKLFSYQTIVSNTKQNPILITVVQLLPRSKDDKIQVDLLAPHRQSVSVSGEDNIKGAGALEEGGVMQNKVSNNLVFNMPIQPGAKIELPFSYAVHWPIKEGSGVNEVEIS